MQVKLESLFMLAKLESLLLLVTLKSLLPLLVTLESLLLTLVRLKTLLLLPAPAKGRSPPLGRSWARQNRRELLKNAEASGQMPRGLPSLRKRPFHRPDPSSGIIIDTRDGVDRATAIRLARIAPDRLDEARKRARRKRREALPARINALAKQERELQKKLKGR